MKAQNKTRALLFCAITCITLSAFALPIAAPAKAAPKKENPSKSITYTEAANIALKKSKGTVVDFDLDHEQGTACYEVEVLGTGNLSYIYDIAISDGSIVKTKKKNFRLETAKKLRSATISYDKAIQTAMKKTGAKKFHSCELGWDDGRLLFEIGLEDDNFISYDVSIDALTGKVLYSESEFDD